jgi:hypothetical protein
MAVLTPGSIGGTRIVSEWRQQPAINPLSSTVTDAQPRPVNLA